MESHKRIVAILYIVMGSLQILTLMFVFMFLSAFLPWIADEAHMSHHEYSIFQFAVSILPAILFAIILVFSLPSIFGGIMLLNGKKWALTLLLIIGCFKLLSFPIGTALGVYTIWVYAEDNKQSVNQPTTNVQA